MSGEEEKERVDHGITSKSTTDSEKDVDISDSSDPEKPPESNSKVAEAAEPIETEYEYVTGVKLWLATAAVTLVCFLMMLDMSIIVTVRLHNYRYAFELADQYDRLSLESQLTFIPSPMWAGMAAYIFYQSK
jgi:hypothetical protein